MYSRKNPWRLRTRLSVALIVLFIAIFAMLVVSHIENTNDRRESRVESMQSVNKTVAAVFEGFMRDLESFSLSTAITLGDARLPISPGDSEKYPAVGSWLSHLHEKYGILRAIFITDPNGIVVYSQDGSSAGFDLSSRDYIKALQGGAADFWSGGLSGAQTGNTTIAYSRAIVDPEGKTTGFLIVAFYPDQLATRIPAGLVDQGHLSVIDDTGKLLYRTPDNPANPAADFSSWPAFQSAAQGSSVLVRDDDIPVAGADRYASVEPLREVGWAVAYSLPASAIEGNANALFQRDMIFTTALLVVGLAGMLYLAGRVSRPLTKLAASAGSISRAEYHGEITDIRGADAEIGVLAATMSEMQVAIRQREERLRNQALVLESLERIGESLAGNLEVEDVARAIGQAGLEAAGAETVFFLERDGPDADFKLIGVFGDQKWAGFAQLPALLSQLAAGATVKSDGPPAQPSDATNGASATPGSVLVLPMLAPSGQPAGALVFVHSAPGAFQDINVRIAGGLARWAGIVRENARLYAQSQEMLGLVQQANVAKDEFLALISHELRTPITTIYGGTRLLRLRRDKLPPEAIEDMFQSIAEEAERLFLLVEDLLAIARTEMAEPVEREPVSLLQVVEQAVTNFSRGHARAVAVRIEEPAPVVLGEPTYLVQVLTNLLSNAAKYSSPDDPIEVEAASEDGEVTVRVIDHGAGVVAAEIEQIFDRFYRSRSTAERASGKGLGLTVCKRLIEALSGRIWAENIDGGFMVCFTLEAADVAQPTPDVSVTTSEHNMEVIR